MITCLPEEIRLDLTERDISADKMQTAANLT
jgi:uncharacterized protein